MSIAWHERYERSQALIDQLSVTVQNLSVTVHNLSLTVQNAIGEIAEDIKESKQLRQELRAQSHENRASMQRWLRTRARENQKAEAHMQDLRESLQESIEYGGRRMDDLARSLKATNDRLERQGFVQGEIAEDLFRRNLPSLLSGYGITEEQVYRNAHMPGRRQYDLVAVNGSLVFVFEVKNKLRENDIKRFCELQLPDFKRVFPIYRDHTVYGGIGALVVKDEMQAQAEKRGLFVLTQGENDSAKLHEPKRPRVF